jgi:hypothetical protein
MIPDPDVDFLPNPDSGSRGKKGIGSRIRNNEKTIYSFDKKMTFFQATGKAY